MRIECYLSESCGSEEAIRANVAQALSLEGVDAVMVLRRVEPAVARALGLSGSPTVLVDGVDVAPPADIAGFA
jgi:hypothetical protein